jgi:hypothetical protein
MPGKTHLQLTLGCDSLDTIRACAGVTDLPESAPEASTNITTEWVCPDCDYFEDVEEESE